MNPQVSIIIPTYNRADFLPQTIESVLGQTFTDYEVLIIDDNSSDNTTGVIKPYLNDPRIKYYKNEVNIGISKNRNKGVLLANGEYIAMLDSDDYWLDKEKLSKQVEILNANKNLVLIGSNITLVNSSSEKISNYDYQQDDLSIRHSMLLANQFAQSSVVFKKDAWKKVGGYDESLIVCEDYDLWLKLGTVGELANLDDYTTAYRIHATSISKDKERLINKNTDILINKNKNNYPRYRLAKLKSYLRLLLSFV